MKARAHIFYSGQVQGIGFRYTVHRLATSLNLKGWVRNLADGRVEIMVDGPKADIEQLCQSILDQFQGYIRDKVIDFPDVQTPFVNFEIRY